MTPIGLGKQQSRNDDHRIPTLWCLLIGVGTYEDPKLSNLIYPEADCQDLGKAIQGSIPSGYQFQGFCHHQNGEFSPNKGDIEASFGTVRQNSTPEDIFLLYFSGHGVLDTSSDQAILCLENTSSADLQATGFSINWIMEQLHQCQATQKLLWLDACHSGGIPWNSINPTPSLIAALSQYQSQGLYALLSCDRHQQSWEFPELGHGVFTHFLIQGLQGQAANEQGQIEVDALYRYVYHQTLGYIDKVNQNQRFLNQQARYLGEGIQQGHYSIQTPKRIVAGHGEFILGQCHPGHPPQALRKALVIDGLGDTKPSLTFSKSLKTSGHFEVVHFPNADGHWDGLDSFLEQELRTAKDPEQDLLLLYIQGKIGHSPTGQAQIQLKENCCLTRSQLQQLLLGSRFHQRLVILDVPGAKNLQPWLEAMTLPHSHSQWMLAGGSPSNPDLFAHHLNETLTQDSAGLSVAQWLSKLQAAPELSLEVWLSGQPKVVEVVPSITTTSPSQDLSLCPYRGLQFFREVDAPFFYGRDRLITDLIQDLQAHAFISVLGPSGSGKSSLIHAGLIAQLREGRSLPHSDTWFMGSLRPGHHPLQSLANWMQDPTGRSILVQGVDAFVLWLRSRPEPRVLCIIDQFEELLTQASQEERDQFLALILGAHQYARDRFSIILSLRSDFLGAAMEIPQLTHRLTAHSRLVPALLNANTYQQIILQPAEQVGLTIEPGLMSLLLRDLETVASPLPILEFVLEKLWHYRKDGSLTIEAYQTHVGGLQGALERAAYATYETLSPQEQDCAQWIFLSLTQINEGAEDTRRQVSYGDLAINKYPEPLLQSTIQALVAAKLLIIHTPAEEVGLSRGEQDDKPPNQDEPSRYELIHEVLIRQWSLLKQWLQTNRTRLQTQRQLEKAAKEWNEAGQQSDFLLRGIRLDAAQEVYETYGSELTAMTQAFIQAGVQQREQETHQAQRQLRFAQGAIALLSLLGTTALILGGLAWKQQKTAQLNEVKTLNALSDSQRLSNQPLAAIQTALTANKKSESLSNRAVQLQSQLTLQEALKHTQATHRWQAHNQRMTAIAKSPSGDWIASGSPDKTLKLWSPAGKQLNSFDIGERITDLSVSPRQNHIIIATAEGNLHRLDLETGKTTATYRYGEWIHQIAMSEDGQTIAVGGRSPSIHLVDYQDFQRLSKLEGHQGWVNAVSFTSDNQLVSAAEDKQVIVWDLKRAIPSQTQTLDSPGWSLASSSQEIYIGDEKGLIHQWTPKTNQRQSYQAHSDIIKKLTLSPDGNALLSASLDHMLKVWNRESMKERYRLEGHSEGVVDGLWLKSNQVFSGSQDQQIWSWSIPKEQKVIEGLMSSASTESLLVGGYWDGSIRFFTPHTSNIDITLEIEGHNAPVVAIAVSPHEKFIASGDTEGEIQIRSGIDGTLIQSLSGHQDTIRDLEFHPKGDRLLSSSDDGSLKQWNLENAPSPKVFQRAGNPIVQISFHPKGQVFATGNQAGKIQLWKAHGQEFQTIQGHKDGVTQLHYSPNGKYLASSGWDQKIQLWNTANLSQPSHLIPKESEIHSLSFSPDSHFIVGGGRQYLQVFETKSKTLVKHIPSQGFEQLHWFKTQIIQGRDQDGLHPIHLGPHE